MRRRLVEIVNEHGVRAGEEHLIAHRRAAEVLAETDDADAQAAIGKHRERRGQIEGARKLVGLDADQHDHAVVSLADAFG